MSKGIGSTKKKRALKAREKQNRQKAAKKLEKFVQALPKISEDDLLSFQFAHFGDDSKPDQWFVKPEDAVEYQPEYDDGLGWYDDGVKRTLTDEEIAVFRRTEEWQLERAKQKLKEKAEAADGIGAMAEGDLRPDADETLAPDVDPKMRAQSPVSDASSLEEELMVFAGLTKDSSTAASSMPKKSSYPRAPPRESRSSRSATPTSASGSSSTSKKRKRKQANDIPYDQRHKRKWESHIVDEDPVEGSLTHRRLARELDDQKDSTVEMDY